MDFFFYFLLLVRKKEERENITGEGRTGWIPVRMEGGGVQCCEAHGYGTLDQVSYELVGVEDFDVVLNGGS